MSIFKRLFRTPLIEEQKKQLKERHVEKIVAKSGLRKGTPAFPTLESFVAFISTPQGLADVEAEAIYNPEMMKNLEIGKRILDALEHLHGSTR
jgi:hypothetical protein